MWYKSFLLTQIIIWSAPAHADSSCGKIGVELMNLSFEMRQEFEKTGSIDRVLEKYNSKLSSKTNEFIAFGKAHPECKKELDAMASEAKYQLSHIQKQIISNRLNVVTYDDWFTMQRTGIKSGKRYSFIACVNGVRNATTRQCGEYGSKAKFISYNADDIKDLETKKKWVNTINKTMCVTAYVTGHEAFVVDIEDQNECR